MIDTSNPGCWEEFTVSTAVVCQVLPFPPSDLFLAQNEKASPHPATSEIRLNGIKKNRPRSAMLSWPLVTE
jgi:hypothetical protein